MDGQAIAITVFSTVRWWGRIWLPIAFHFARLFPGSLGMLRQLSFIHFARWTLVRRFPGHSKPKPRGKQRYMHLFFESNFNGGWEEYIDAFSYVLTPGMKVFWGSSYGFPGPVPTGPFKDYIRRNEIEASHYYSAYPEATTTIVSAALELEPRVAELRRSVEGMSPAEFAAAWSEFVTDAQSLL